MATKLRIGSFNVENLFERPKVFNFKDHDDGDEILSKVDKLRDILKKEKYTEANKKQIVKLYTQDLKDYIEIKEDRGKLFKRQGWSIKGIHKDVSGQKDWDGTVVFKPSRFSKKARENTAKVIKDIRADILCIVETENRKVLQSFDTHLLNNKYKYEFLIDAYDPRGIDVGLYSKFPLGKIYTHMFDKIGNSRIFSRDCLEVEVKLNGKSLFMLCNHFKSRGYDYDGKSDAKRKRQANKVKEILKKYKLSKDYVVVAGDFNDSPDSAPLKSLLETKYLYDVLELQYPSAPNKRWTYHYNKFEQIDFILISKPLKNKFVKAGVERRGMYKLEKLTTSSGGQVEVQKEYDKVTHWTNAASDHGAVWAEFKI